MNYILKSSQLLKSRFIFFNLRKSSSIFEHNYISSLYGHVTNINKEINKIFSAEPVTNESLVNLFSSLSPFNLPPKNISQLMINKIRSEITRKKVKPNAVYYNEILRFLNLNKIDYDPKSFIDEICENKIIINRDTLYLLLMKYCLSGDLQNSKIIHDKLDQSILNNKFSCALMIACCIKANDDKFQTEMLELAKQYNFIFSISEYKIIISSYASVLNVNKCIETFDEMISKIENPTDLQIHLYKSYITLAEHGATEEQLLQMINSMKKYSSENVLVPTMRNLFVLQLYSQAVFLIENLNIKISENQWFKWCKDLMIIFHPAKEILEYFSSKLSNPNQIRLWIRNSFEFEDSLKIIDTYYFVTDDYKSNLDLISDLLCCALRSSENHFKIRTVFHYCRSKMSMKDFNSSLMISWMKELSFETRKIPQIIQIYTIDLESNEKKCFILCFIGHLLLKHRISEAVSLFEQYSYLKDVDFSFDYDEFSKRLIEKQPISQINSIIQALNYFPKETFSCLLQSIFFNFIKSTDSSNLVDFLSFLNKFSFVVSDETWNLLKNSDILPETIDFLEKWKANPTNFLISDS